MAWTDLSAAASGTPPEHRYYHGFTSASGRLYVHGGFNGVGGESHGRVHIFVQMIENRGPEAYAMRTLPPLSTLTCSGTGIPDHTIKGASTQIATCDEVWIDLASMSAGDARRTANFITTS